MITMLCSEKETGARDISAQWQTSFSDSVKPEDRKLFVRDSYEGCVLATYERNGYDDSDFYALVWDEASQKVVSIEYGTTRGWSYPNTATVDASEEIQAKAIRYYVGYYTNVFNDIDIKRSQKVAKGKTCDVVKGRKIPKGQRVEVIGNPVNKKFNSWSADNWQVLVKCADGSLVHTAVTNLAVATPEHYRKSPEEIRGQAESFVKNNGWYGRSTGVMHLISAGAFR